MIKEKKGGRKSRVVVDANDFDNAMRKLYEMEVTTDGVDLTYLLEQHHEKIIELLSAGKTQQYLLGLSREVCN